MNAWGSFRCVTVQLTAYSSGPKSLFVACLYQGVGRAGVILRTCLLYVFNKLYFMLFTTNIFACLQQELVLQFHVSRFYSPLFLKKYLSGKLNQPKTSGSLHRSHRHLAGIANPVQHQGSVYLIRRRQESSHTWRNRLSPTTLAAFDTENQTPVLH